MSPTPWLKRLARHSLLTLLVPFVGCGEGDRRDPASAGRGNVIERTFEKGPVKLSVRVWPREPRLSDLLQMEVSVESSPGVEIKSPAFGQAVGDFLVRDYSERPPEKGAENRRQFHYELEPAHAGKHLLRSVAIEFVDKRPGSEGEGKPALIETEPLEVNVTSELANEVPSLAQLQPMEPPRGLSQGVALGWIVAAVVVAVLAVLGFVMLRRCKRKPVEPPRKTPEEIAHAALASLLAENLPARGLIKEFYLRLTGIVRQYVEDTTGIRAPDQTTEEFLRDIRARAIFYQDRSLRLADFLESADLVKYAGQQPEDEQIHQAIARAREFVNLAPVAAVVGD